MKSLIYLLFSFIFLDANWQDMLIEQKEALQKDKYILATYNNENNLTAYAILDIDKNINEIYKEILTFEDYPNKISSISNAKTYQRDKKTIKVVFTFSKFFISFDNYFVHKINNKDYKITWNLDKNKPSSMLDTSSGQWWLKKIDKYKTRVFYTNTLSAPKWVPSIIKNYMITNASKDGALWLLDK